MSPKKSTITAGGLFGRIMKGFFSNLLSNVVIKPLTTAMSVVFMWVFHALVKLSGKEGFKAVDKIVDTYYTTPNEWVKFVASYVENMTGQRISIEDMKRAGARTVSSSTMRAFSHNIMNSLLNLIVPKGLIDEQKGQEAAERYLSVNMQFQMNAWLLHLLGDVMSFGMFKSLKDLPNAISWSFGLGWLSWLVMGTPFQKSIVTPLEWKYNAYLRPERMNTSQLMQSYRQGLIDTDRWNYELEQLGWRNEDKAILYNLTEKDLPDTFIRDNYLYGFITEGQAVKLLQQKGYSKQRAKSVLSYYKISERRDLMEKIYKEYEDLYINDRVDRRHLETLAKSLYPDSITRELILNLSDMKKAKTRTLTYSQIKQAMDNGIIGVSTARKRLLNLGYSPEDTDILIRTWTKK